MSGSDGLSCIFCKIISGALPAKVVFEDATCICIEDRFPQAKFHVLVLPKRHMRDVTEADEATLGALMSTVNRVAASSGLMPNGFRIAINTGAGGGQTVFHAHVHLMADKVKAG